MSVEEITLSFIDPWFLDQIEEIIAAEGSRCRWHRRAGRRTPAQAEARASPTRAWRS
jgi:hypothetical protein